MKKQNKIAYAILPAFVGASLPVAGYAADWEISPSLSVIETYTDNVDLDSAQAEGDFITQVAPTIAIKADGARLDLNLNYTPNYFYYPDAVGDKDEIRHNLAFSVHSELSQDLFFVDANADINQRYLDRRQAISSVDGSRTLNRATIQTYRMRPYLTRHFGSFADARLEANVRHVRSGDRERLDNAGSDFEKATSYGSRLTVDSGSQFSRIGWSYAVYYNNQQRVSVDDYVSYGTRLDGSYRVNRMLSLLGSAGYESRDANDNAFVEFDNFVWDAGFRLVPGPRTSISFRYGNQYRGDTFSLSAFYRITPKAQLSVTYRDLLETYQTLEVIDSFVVDPFSGEISNNGIDFLDDSFVRTKTWRVALQGERGRTSYSISGSNRRYSSEVASRNEERWTAAASLTRRISRRLTASVNGSFSYSEYNFNVDSIEAPVDDKFWSAGANISYRISESLTSALSYVHSDRTGTRSPLLNRPSNYISFSIRAAL
ncbi:TIGR03016 family PEP-CTERM system-associated outer membrane protein [Emcibacter sp.]|uniref:TIGR03016 family PEP-CTERM system-associated outer membrane protein n=1 Tax=Emcibacter sp. TaxID=1979954 RepID=UPI002AA83194|nr:TIGR03016 family PEP-CTERM system-associated outer membrane protein [Emcibacter sp.]